EVLVDVARGFEYEPLRTRLTIAPGQQELVLRLKRWRDMNAQRWFSGDTHVHFLSTQGSHTEAQGEDLNVVNLLLSQWGHLFTNSEEFTGRANVSANGRTIVYASQENRQHLLGHLTLLGLKKQVMPWCSDGPSEAELGGTLEITMSDWADQCHAQGGTVILPHLPNPNGEPATLIATGRADAVEMLEHGLYKHHEYYRYLNGGYRLPLVGGTDKMSNQVPVGLYRTYVFIPPDQDFTYETWCRNLAAGRTFLSGGPMISLTVEGHMVGDTVRLPGNGGTVEVEASAESIFPIHRLEIVQQGRVVAAVEEHAGTRGLRLKTALKVDGHTWLAARVGGPGYTQTLRHHDVWSRGVMAHTSPIYIACGEDWRLFDERTAQYMLTLIDGSLSYIRELSPRYRPGTVTHHHGEHDHQAYLERPFLEAQMEIHRRMHERGGGV
ncbi:MAG: CehA/McbA family metallohydrolase, partial [Chloroflexota bacterium]